MTNGGITLIFQVLLSSVYTESRTFQLLTPPCQQGGWGCIKIWEQIQPGQLTPRSLFHTICCYDQYTSEGENQAGAAGQELAGHHLAGEQLHCESLVLYIPIILLLLLKLMLFSLHFLSY